MAINLKKFRDQAKKIIGVRTNGGPKNDIQRENIELDSGNESGYRFSSVIGDIKKNWSDIKLLNKKF